MRKVFFYFFIFLFLSFNVSARDCSEPLDFMEINSSLNFCSDSFDLPGGIKITHSDIILDCGTAVLRGNLGESEAGITLENVENVTIRNCNVVTYNIAVLMKNATHCLIEDNAFLKGRIGIRMFDSYENLIQDNVDKSTVKSVSALNSKFNLLALDNRNIEQGFCDVNVCNKFVDIDPCVDGDFYCSKNCNASTDSDCVPFGSFFALKFSQNGEDVFDEEKLRKKIEADSLSDLVKDSVENKESKKDFPLFFTVFFSIVIYIISFITYQKYEKFSK